MPTQSRLAAISPSHPIDAVHPIDPIHPTDPIRLNTSVVAAARNTATGRRCAVVGVQRFDLFYAVPLNFGGGYRFTGPAACRALGQLSVAYSVTIAPNRSIVAADAQVGSGSLDP